MFVHWFQFQFQLVKGPFVLRGGRLEVSRAKSCPRNVSLATGPGLKKVPSPESERGRHRDERVLPRIAVRELSRKEVRLGSFAARHGIF